MSVVTNVIVHVGLGEKPETLAAFCRPLEGDERGQTLCPITAPLPDGSWSPAQDAWGGTRCPEVELYAAAFNHVPTEDILRHIGSVPWMWADYVEIFICEEGESSFDVYRFEKGKLTCVLAHRP